ncbi:MAG: CDGSH iron-sulfur domain-containing protein [bacterium]|nr:CDGSH iron-sulfur domain-containing protein [bacterium]
MSEKSFQPKVAQKSPFVLEEEAGKKRAWCSCGLSTNQPYCDGAHARETTGMSPMVVTCETSGKVPWCGCKHTKTPPYCDGSHNSLP